MTRYVIGSVTDIPPGSRKIVTIARRSIGIFNVKGKFFAIRNQCPHAGGELCKGTISGFVRSQDPGQYEYIMQGEVIRCPWHGWEFEIATGQSWFDPVQTRVATYPADVQSGRVLSGRDDVAAAEVVRPTGMPEDAGLTPGPFRTESYQVEVDNDFVVVHL